MTDEQCALKPYTLPDVCTNHACRVQQWRPSDSPYMLKRVVNISNVWW